MKCKILAALVPAALVLVVGNVELVAQENGLLRIRSVPPGARIVLNSTDELGVTPEDRSATLEYTVEVGEHLLMAIQGEGARQESLVRAVKIAAGDTLDVVFDFVNPTALVTIETIPTGGRVFVNQEYKGVAPVPDIPLAPGQHVFSAEKACFLPAERTYDIEEGTTQSYNLILETQLRSGTIALEISTPVHCQDGHIITTSYRLVSPDVDALRIDAGILSDQTGEEVDFNMTGAINKVLKTGEAYSFDTIIPESVSVDERFALNIEASLVRRKSKRIWLWAGLGLAAGGATAYFILGPTGGLPTPPGRPS